MKKIIKPLFIGLMLVCLFGCNNTVQKPIDNPEPEVTSTTYYLVTDANEVEDYNPYVTLSSDGTFFFIENVYEGMNEYKGTYTKDDCYYVLKVESVKLIGFAGSELKEIKFYINDEESIQLLNDVCYSRCGYYFTTTKTEPKVINPRPVDLVKFTGKYNMVYLENEGGVLYPEDIGATHYIEFKDDQTFDFHQDSDEASIAYLDMKYDVYTGYLYAGNMQEDDFYLVATYKDGVDFDMCMDEEGFVLVRWYIEYDPEEYPIVVFYRFVKES